MFPHLIDLGHVDLPLLGETHLAIPTYGAMVALALIVSWAWFMRNAQRAGIDPLVAARLAVWTVIFGLVGAKLGLVLVELPRFLAHPGDLFTVGMLQAAGVVWAGLLGGLAGVAFLAWKFGEPLAPILDAAALPIPLAQALGRMGCLAAGCCFGSECLAPWAITYHSLEARAQTGVPLGVPLHPTPVYEALWSLAIVLPLLFVVRRNKRFPGEVALAYLASYAVGRFIVEFFRGDALRGMWFEGLLSTSQLISAMVAPIAIALWWSLRRAAANRPAPHRRHEPLGSSGTEAGGESSP